MLIYCFLFINAAILVVVQVCDASKAKYLQLVGPIKIRAVLFEDTPAILLHKLQMH